MRLPTLERASDPGFFHNLWKPRRPGSTPWWAWGAPFAVVVVVLYRPTLVPKLTALLVLVALVALVARKPALALKVLIVVMPFHQAILATLFNLGLPVGIVRPMSQWKEALILGVLVVAGRKAARARHELDLLDKLALAYVGLGMLYVLVPGFFVGDAAGATLGLTTRTLGFRSDVVYVALFLAARHLHLPPDERRSVARTFLVTATIVCGLTFVEYLFQDFWNTLWLDWVQLPRYRVVVLGSIDPNFYSVQVHTDVAGREVLRAGSVLFLPFALGCYGVVAVSVFASRLGRGAAHRGEYLGLLVAGTTVLLTVTRSAIFGLAVALVITLFARVREMNPTVHAARVRFALVLAAVFLVALPVTASLGVVDRFVGRDDYSSNEEHRAGVERGYRMLWEHPFGRGLATGAGTGQAQGVANVAITESQLLQIGTQLGVIGLVLWVLVVVHLILALRRAERRAPPGADTWLLAGTWIALVGLAAAGIFLQIFTEFSLSWSLWILAGVALGSSEAEVSATAAGYARVAATP